MIISRSTSSVISCQKAISPKKSVNGNTVLLESLEGLATCKMCLIRTKQLITIYHENVVVILQRKTIEEKVFLEMNSKRFYGYVPRHLHSRSSDIVL